VAITEETRHQLFQRLEQVLGADEAATLMEHLPPVGWADVATKHDLEHQRVALSSDIELVRVALSSDIDLARVQLGNEITSLRTELGNEIQAVRTDLGNEITSLRTELRNDIGAVRTELCGAIEHQGDVLRAEMFREQRNHTLAMIVANTTIAALVVAALQVL
jgi:hypothetical protein